MPAKTIEQSLAESTITLDLVKKRIEEHYKKEFQAGDFEWHRTNNSPWWINLRTNSSKLPRRPGEDRRYGVMYELRDKVFKDDGAYIDYNRRSYSTIGGVKIGPIFVYIKPRVGEKAKGGEKNEVFIVTKINELIPLGTRTGIDIKFLYPPRRQWTVKNVIRAEHVARDTKGNKKADVNFITARGYKIPLSIKQSDADFWEGIEGWFYNDRVQIGRLTYKNEGDRLLDIANNTNLSNSQRKFIDIQRLPNGQYHMAKASGMLKNFALKAPKDLKIRAVFGSDILRDKGAVIQKTFNPEDFKFQTEPETIIINCDNVIKALTELPEAYIIFINGAGRSAKSKYKGIMPLIATPKRARAEIRLRLTNGGKNLVKGS